MTLGILVTRQIDVLDVEADIPRRVAEELVFTDVSRLEDGVQGGEDAEAGVDLGQVSVEVTRAAGQLDQELTLHPCFRCHTASCVVILSLMTTDLACCLVLVKVPSRPHGGHVDEAKVCECCEARVPADCLHQEAECGLVLGPGEAQRLGARAGRGEEDQVQREAGPGLQRGDDQGAGGGGQGGQQ